ncbi:hypothetical protein R3W88_033904 [Solanum pinnatisectum]|uniref:RNase H type-1 domain-containing protein n=1 Tax=Solanum pinnatisectum TaxID=50273 RepID=A0AAV9K014_9SOLN|nr:hypothetical protein R3W88_033904 [Solanum pinnatisectum]
MIEKCKQEVRVTSVIWKSPPSTRYKLNTDGSALHNPGKIGGGGILRNEHGDMIYAFAIPLGEGTNNQAEVQATSTPPWRMQRLVQELQKHVNKCVFLQCVHIYKEANSTPDFLSKQSHRKDIIQHYYTYTQLPNIVRGSYILEKMGVQSFRRKKLKRIKKPP